MPALDRATRLLEGSALGSIARRSDVVLDVGLALGDARLVDGSPVATLDGGDEGEDGLEPDAADAHPVGVEEPAEDPGGGNETSRFNELQTAC